VHYAAGSSLAEAFYQSVTGPYQLLIVGDPLCTPWKRDLPLGVSAPSIDTSWKDSVTIKTQANSQGTRFSLFVDGVQVESLNRPGEFEINTRKLDDGEHRISVVARSSDSVQTVSRWTCAAMIENHAHRKLELSCHRMVSGSSTECCEIKTSCAGAISLEVFHLQRSVCRFDGEAGSKRVDLETIGSGPARLSVVAKFPDGTKHRRETVADAN
jgi:hypothetical protein